MPIGLKIKKLLKENQQGGHIVPPPPPSRNRVNPSFIGVSVCPLFNRGWGDNPPTLESNCAMALKFRMIIYFPEIYLNLEKIIQKVSSIVIKTMPIEMAIYTL